VSSAKPISVRPGSSRGLMARPILANNQPALRSVVSTVGYKVTNLTTGASTPSSGYQSLTPADVFYTALQTPFPGGDAFGYSFLWRASGTLWPDASTDYFIDIQFTTTDGLIYLFDFSLRTEAR
jgi:hypothetical protein